MKKLCILLALLALCLAAFAGCEPALPTQGGTPADCSAGHTDADNNGSCDSCKTSVLVDFDLFGINDLHGMFTDSDSQPGVDELTTYLKNAAQSNPNTIVFSSGDMWQGSAESGLTKGLIMTDWMNHLDFAFMTMGNHEFDWGTDAVRANDALAEFPFLAINVFDAATDRQADFCQSSLMVDLGHIQLGFIGAIGDCHSSISGEYNTDFYFKVGDELTELVKAEADRLRAQGADFIVYSIHDSIDSYDQTLSRGYVDLVFEGHSHSEYIRQDSRSIYHIQASSYNAAIASASVSYNFANGQYTVVPRIVRSSEYSKGTSDSIVEDLMDKYSEKTQIMEENLGYNQDARDDWYLRQLLAELYAGVASERWPEYDIMLGGGYFSCRSPGYLAEGDVTYSDLYTLFPFDNKLALCTCSGQNLLDRFIHTTNDSYFIAFTEYGNTHSVDPEGTYYLITDSYNYTYAPNNLTVVEIYDTSTYARDLLAKYIQAGGLETEMEPLTDSWYYDIKTLIRYVAALPENTETEERVYTAGTVREIISSTHGQMVIEDHTGYYITLYNLYEQTTGNRYDAMAHPPQVGDVILIQGTLKNYVSASGGQTLEFARAELVRLPNPDDPNTSSTAPQLIALTLALGPGNQSEEFYTFTGTIIEIVSDVYGNAYLIDDNGNEFYFYGLYKDGKRYGDMENPPQVGDTITVYGVLKYYVDRYGDVFLEMVNGEIL